MLPGDSIKFASDAMEEDTISVSNSTSEAWNEYFYTLRFLAFAFALPGSHA